MSNLGSRYEIGDEIGDGDVSEVEQEGEEEGKDEEGIGGGGRCGREEPLVLR